MENEKVNELENEITIIKIEPHQEPEVISIPNTLKALQELVGGHIEGLGITPTAHIFVNEEGKLRGLEPNRRFKGDILVGTIIITGTEGPELVSLTPEQIRQYTEQFKHPEEIDPSEIGQTMAWDFFFF